MIIEQSNADDLLIPTTLQQATLQASKLGITTAAINLPMRKQPHTDEQYIHFLQTGSQLTVKVNAQ